MATGNSSQPNAQAIQALINALNSGQLAQAEVLAKTLIAKHANTFVLHHVLALALDGQQKFIEAVISYQNALKLQSNMPDLQFNLGIALTQINRLDEAANAYLQAIRIQPNFFEAHGNLGTILQRQGKLEDAIVSYQKGLKINPQDARGHFNLGTALRDKGDLPAAINAYKKAIELFPNYTDAHNNLGETLRDAGDMGAAVKSYQAALALNAGHANANCNMAEFLYLAKKYEEAIPYFERSQLDDWQARIMYCLYKAEQFAAFKTKLDEIVKIARHNSPFIGTLAKHYAINFGVENSYNFCKNPFDFVYRAPIAELAQPNSVLLKQLLDDINHADIAERVQGMLTNGKQSAGNLFKRPEASFRSLSELIKQQFLAYKNNFKDADCELILSFPTELEFTSSWYVKMRSGGHLSPHIHEIGWLSGAVYLAMPTPKAGSNEGAFEYGTHGDDYPIGNPQLRDQFATASVLPNVGDIVLFPSSLFHRTIPYLANENRICIAFDLKPAP
ncbi:MAG: tetratricopeptide repeat protein [Bdellovibrio sp.]|nr:tetratricopeptide repeat protein [Methylotenera sp.]